MRTFVATALICLSFHPALGKGPLHGAASINADSLASEVRKEFLHAWNAYKTYAWGHDGLRPLSKSFYDWQSVPFYLSAVDALDTMILMGLKSEADSTRDFVAAHLSFNHDVYVKNFEFTIRLLGGLISGYQLSGDRRLLTLAEDLATRMLPAFNSPTGMPYMYVNLKTGAVREPRSNPAEIGTLLVEYGSLSKLTGKPAYYNAAKNALRKLYSLRSNIGLVGTAIDIETGKWLDPDSHVSACIDSYYEYLVKCQLLFDDNDCRAMWDSSYAALNRYVADTAASGFWYGHVNMETGKRTRQWFGALDAFFPAALVLAGDLPRAQKLQESCVKMWNLHGIEPDELDYGTMTVTGERYFLNPEIMESTYYLYQATRDPRYLLMGKSLFDSLRTYCRAPAGYAELKSVITKVKSDRMESYFLAETLKYLYLLFAPPSTLDFKHVIFNTEAHPIRRTW
jgi:mannosidase alpha-like ER degradation enhancer 2